ncbi:hypothetical protein L195_g049845 [Trifolium pratense]|uniref:Uncharacterized protein n=1 Tax=Trifolium pratense TaxID=57577 RepID=A0A2K3JQP8_TRIPR|nr:hypothetical protein L195_g049845 [Trifolium pratense]
MPKVELQLDHNASTSQQVVAELDESSLCATTHSGGAGRNHDDALIGGSSGTNWNNVANNGVDEPEVPLWEWDHLNWM